MGGTSTDVSHFAGEYERVVTAQVAGVRLQAPMLDIHTVAAERRVRPALRRQPLPCRPGLRGGGPGPPPATAPAAR
ncbi:hypothetical protein GCM10020000_04120 [Streptomyces olivoverticillatus]